MIYVQSNQSQKLHINKHLRTRHSCWNQRSKQLVFVRKSGQRSINTNMAAVILTFIYFIPSKVFYGMTTGRDIQISWIFYWRSYIQITYIKTQVKEKMGWQQGLTSYPVAVPFQLFTSKHPNLFSSLEISAFMWALDLGVSLACVFESPLKAFHPWGSNRPFSTNKNFPGILLWGTVHSTGYCPHSTPQNRAITKTRGFLWLSSNTNFRLIGCTPVRTVPILLLCW